MDQQACEHSVTEMRCRTISNGSVQYVHQCVDCGIKIGNPVKRDIAVRWHRGPPPPFDEVLFLEGREATQSNLERERQLEKAARRKEYAAYLGSPEWKARRAAVIHRSGGICEGCRASAATQVHHLTYDHIYDEFLWELVAICEACHERVHAERGDF